MNLISSTRNTPLLEVKNFSLTFHSDRKDRQEPLTQVIRQFDITIREGEIMAVVGASGSGKSLLADAILGILPENATCKGMLHYKGEPLTEKRRKHLCGDQIMLIPQSLNALDPLMKTGKQVQTVMKGKGKKDGQRAVFRKVGLPDHVSNQYPFELSGGMARRVLIATAMVSNAHFIIADEATPGIDPHALGEMVTFIKHLAMEGKGVMFITHDIETALQVADKVAVFYAGETVEIANVEDFSGTGETLRHPYTKALWNSLPQNGFVPLEGHQPLADEKGKGCAFQPRCQRATDICLQKQPESRIVKAGMVRCFHA
ncbi:ABC transporter ATP-binding protein [Bacillus piscicola]|uniref:oligopeptide/dipeptide ABC transporter ATP-binding protein n=1 Tax=Bacillus piscicola TaxID=1632684 RepID=UPI001F09FEE2|nr:ABC transporter ATP-binding protein [Bacillus piscicola]